MADKTYCELIKYILLEGEERDDRTGIGTISIFSPTLRFDISEHFPLLTCKYTWFKGIITELLWFIKGSTNAKELSAQGVKIWDGNTSREFLDKRGLFEYAEGDIGPGYGFQWRHSGARYVGCNANYNNQGIDQLSEIIYLLKNDPTSRRILMSSWSPIQLSEMALPPCHVSCQFYVSKGKYLKCKVFQRSVDVGLGLPFNIASYAALTYILAKLCGYEPSELIFDCGDTHIYKNHISALREMAEIWLSKTEHCAPPTLKIKDGITLESLSPSDFILCNYTHDGMLKLDMAV